MLTTMFILSLALVALSVFLMTLTMKINLPEFRYKRNVSDMNTAINYPSAKKTPIIDIGILSSHDNKELIKTASRTRYLPTQKSMLLLEYKTGTND